MRDFPSRLAISAARRLSKSRTRPDSVAQNEMGRTPARNSSGRRFAKRVSPSLSEGRFTHLRLKIYPDGGVARLRVHGEVVPDRTRIARPEIDLASIVNGARIIQSSDEFFGVPLNLLMPGLGKNMGDGWETRRRRGPGHDWTIVKLGVPGEIRRVEVDTSHFKGNFPESCSLEACDSKDGDASDVAQLAGLERAAA